MLGNFLSKPPVLLLPTARAIDTSLDVDLAAVRHIFTLFSWNVMDKKQVENILHISPHCCG
jgi:hypothetical protein